MPKQSRTTLKGYFNRGDKPTEEQFADLIDSMRHNDDNVPISKIDGLPSELSNYVTNAQFQAAIATKITTQLTVSQPTFVIPQGRLVVYAVLVSTFNQTGIGLVIDETNEILLENVDLTANIPAVSQIQIYAATALTMRLSGHSGLITITFYVL